MSEITEYEIVFGKVANYLLVLPFKILGFIAASVFMLAIFSICDFIWLVIAPLHYAWAKKPISMRPLVPFIIGEIIFISKDFLKNRKEGDA